MASPSRRALRVTIDGSCLLGPSAGVKTYLHHWISALLELAPQAFRVFPFLGRPAELDCRRSSFGRLHTRLGHMVLHFANTGDNPVLELSGLTADVFHALQHLKNPPRRWVRLTATIWDMTCWLVPQFHQPANVQATMGYGERVLRRAAAAIAISESSRQDAIDILKLPQDRVRVIYPGVAEAFFSVSAEQVLTVRRRLGLDRAYVLYVGTIEPRKNVEGLIRAYQHLAGPLRDAFQLVLAGPMGWCEASTERLVRSQSGGIRYLGYVSEDDLPALTAGAAAFAFPSFYEGFGLPVAQAMAAGVPVITSRGSSLGEIASGAGILVEPGDVDSIAHGMAELLESPGLAARLAAEARQRAQNFRWSRAARESLEFFQAVAQG